MDTVTEEEWIDFACRLFEGKRVSYWQMKHPPNYKQLEESFNGGKELSKEEQERAEAIKEDARRREWWKNKAKALLADRNAKRNDLETAEIGTRSNAQLNQQLKERIKETRR